MTKEQAILYAANKLLREIDCLSRQCDECPLSIKDDEGRFQGCIGNILDNRCREMGLNYTR